MSCISVQKHETSLFVTIFLGQDLLDTKYLWFAWGWWWIPWWYRRDRLGPAWSGTSTDVTGYSYVQSSGSEYFSLIRVHFMRKLWVRIWFLQWVGSVSGFVLITIIKNPVFFNINCSKLKVIWNFSDNLIFHFIRIPLFLDGLIRILII